MTRIEVYVLDDLGLYTVSREQVPKEVKEKRSQDFFLEWLYGGSQLAEQLLNSFLRNGCLAIFVADWLDDEDYN